MILAFQFLDYYIYILCKKLLPYMLLNVHTFIVILAKKSHNKGRT